MEKQPYGPNPFEEKSFNNPIFDYEKRLWKKLQPFDVKSDKLEFVSFPANRYIPETSDKKQIVLHHTVSCPHNSIGDINYWASTEQRVATCVIVNHSGKVYQCFSSKLWAYHLGAGNAKLDEGSIGIEVDSWGPLILGDNENKKFGNKIVKTKKDAFYNAYGQIVNLKDDEIQYFENGFRGYEYYQKYSDQQIDSVGELILLWNKTYGIPLDYNEDMWEVSERALKGEPGIWSHTSYRKDKSDVFPQPELINMLKSLNS